MERFRAPLVPVPHGGHYVVVPPEVAVAAGLRHGLRVRGTVDGAAYRSSLMMYGGVFHLGLHKAVLAACGAGPEAVVEVAIEADDAPLPTDEAPPELAAALATNALAQAGYEGIAPSHRREHVKAIIDAKRPETRAKRVAAALEAFEQKGRALAQKAAAKASTKPTRKAADPTAKPRR